MIGGGVVGGLDPVEDIDGDGARHAGNISAYHEHDAELSHGVGEAQGRAGDQSGNGERGDHAKKSAQRGSAQGGRRRN